MSATKAGVELVADRANRVLRLIMLRQSARILNEDGDDAAMDVTPEIKRAWNDKIDSLQADIKAVVATWP